jgi:Winged helix DNA-binding domain
MFMPAETPPSEIIRLRLLNQGLSSGDSATAVDIVGRLGAVQAQDFKGALWAVGGRLPGARERDILGALNRGEIVRSWPMRGTLHFVLPEDLPWMLRLLAPRIMRSAARRHRDLELTAADFRKAEAFFRRTLRGGRAIERRRLMTMLDAAGVSTADQRGAHLVLEMAHRGVICFGPIAGKQQTLVLLEEWVGEQKVISREAALRRVAEVYFRGHGPARIDDFLWWTGLTATEGREALEAARGALQQLTCSGKTYWLFERNNSVDTPARSADARLLPAFDEYFVGYRERSLTVSGAEARRIAPLSLLSPAVLLAGQHAGTWNRRLAKSVSVQVRATKKLKAREKDLLREEVQRYGEFLELPTEIAFSS